MHNQTYKSYICLPVVSIKTWFRLNNHDFPNLSPNMVLNLCLVNSEILATYWYLDESWTRNFQSRTHQSF